MESIAFPIAPARINDNTMELIFFKPFFIDCLSQNKIKPIATILNNVNISFALLSSINGKKSLMDAPQAMPLFSTNNSLSAKQIKSESDGIVALKEVFDSSVEKIPTLSAVGYAVVSSQPGRTDAQKRLMAIRSARMAAMRELAEQIHGIQVDSNTTVIDLMVQNDTFRAVVKGIIRGAKTVRINPTGVDTYETVLEIDKDMMLMMLRNARRT